MKPTGAIIAERPVAQHCPELLGSQRQPPDRKQALAEWLGEMCGALAQELRSLLIGPRPAASASDKGSQTAASLEPGFANGHIHYLIKSDGPLPRMVASFDIATALALTDRLFGGSGAKPDVLPERLPQSSVYAVERFVGAVARAVAAGHGQADLQAELASHHNFARLEAFPRGQYCCNLTVNLEQNGFDAASFTLLALEADVHAMLDGTPSATRAEAATNPEEQARLAPFNAIPLQLRAELAELQLSLAKLAGLRPGEVIPIAPRREIPLILDGRRIATGAIGTLDEQVALRLTTIF